MPESIYLTHADVAALADRLARLVTERLEPMLTKCERRLVDRPTMAKLSNLGTATLDRLVAAGKVPSVLVGKRRLFDPEATIDALVAAEVIHLETTL